MSDYKIEVTQSERQVSVIESGNTVTISSSGVTGAGVAAGGTTGQLLAKNSNADYDTEWVDAPNSAVWGLITGTLSNQTDLQNALNAKQNSLGFTPENVANKATDLLSPDNTKYPTTLAVSNAIAAITVPVTSVFGRTGNVTAQSGDYTTAQVTESGNLYFTNARVIAAPLTGFTAGAGTVSPTDSILQALQKLSGNDDLRVLKAGDTMTGALNVNGSANAVQLRVRGNATQTANIFEVQDSASTNLLRVNNTGRITGATTAETNALVLADSATIYKRFTVSYPATFTTRLEVSNHFQIDGDGNGLVANFRLPTPQSGSSRFGFLMSTTEMLTIRDSGNVGINTTGPTSQFQVITSSASKVAEIIRAASGQTANISEWQNSGGTVLAAVNSAGELAIGASSTSGWALRVLSTTNNTASFFGNSGTAIVGIGANGTLESAGGTYYIRSASGVPLRLGANFQEHIRVTTAGDVGIGTTTPVDKLQIVGGNITVDSARRWKWVGGSFIEGDGTANLMTFRSLGSYFFNGVNVGIGIDTPTARLQVHTSSASNIGQIIRASTSQTANLTEWQDNAGTVLSSVNSLGYLSLTPATATATGNVLSITQTWNNAGSTFKGIDLNITNTASGVSSRIVDFRVGGSSVFSIQTSGQVNIAQDLSLGNTVLFWSAGSQIRNSANGVIRLTNASPSNDWDRLQLGGTSNAYPALARSSTNMVSVLADGTAGGGFGVGMDRATGLVASAILQADSTTKGFLQPRMTTVQRDAISSPATGLEVYNTSVNRPNVYNGSRWVDTNWDWALTQARDGFQLFNDFMGTPQNFSTGELFTTAQGTNANTLYLGGTVPSGWGSNNQGFLMLTAGTTASGYAALVYGNNNFQTHRLDGGVTIFEALILVETLSDGTDTYGIEVGFRNQATNSLNIGYGAMFLYSVNGAYTGATASANWQCVTSQNNARTWTTTSVAVATNTPVRLRVSTNSTYTEVYFHIDGVLVATHTTNLPVATNTGTLNVTPRVAVAKSAGTNHRYVWVDYMLYTKTFNTPRY